jgi:hypothetical protein
MGMIIDPYRFGPQAVGLTLVNPGFETGDATGWTQYYQSGPQIRAVGTDPGTSGFPGSFYAAASASSVFPWWGQDVSIPALHHTLIDAGEAEIELKILRVGFSDADAMCEVVEFYDGSSNLIGFKAGPYTDPTVITQENLSALVPPLTRTVRISVRGRRESGTQNSAYVDAFELFIQSSGQKIEQAFFNRGDSFTGWTATLGSFDVPTGQCHWNYNYIRGLLQNSDNTARYDTAVDSGLNSLVDAGSLTAHFFVELGNTISFANDAIRMTVECLDASNAVLATIQTAATPTIYEKYYEIFEGSVAVPALTRTIRLNLILGNAGPGNNLDACWQNAQWFLIS